MVRRFLWLFLVLPAVADSAGTATASELHPQVVRDFIKNYCYACHDADLHKAGLRLDQLPLEFEKKEHFDVWEKVHDKLHSGQMPPEDEEQPKAQERSAVQRWLQSRLHSASFARQRAEGRVRLRRLNRTAYENTLADLLAVPAEVKDLLPEDTSAAGFDNVSATFDVSSAHLVRYQQAAEKALAMAVPTRPEQRLELKLDASAIYKRNPGGFTRFHVRLKDDELIVLSRLLNYFNIDTPPAPQAGRYHVRLTASPMNTDGKSMPVVFWIQKEAHLSEGEVQTWRDLPPGEATSVEAEIVLQRGQKATVVGWSLPDYGLINGKLKSMPIDEYTGPALAIESLEVEGPLDTWPPESYRRLFGDLPLKARSVVQAEAAGKPIPRIDDVRKDSIWDKDPMIPVSAEPHNDAERLMRAFVPRAFRRPVSDELLQYYVDFVQSRLDRGYEFHAALLAGYKAVLCSPHFLFLDEAIARPRRGNITQAGGETSDRQSEGGRLDDYAIASRLSYFLWSSMPDEALLACAAQKTLTQPAVLHEQVERMLRDPRAERFTADFVGQWLDLRKMNDTSPDPTLYREFDRMLWSSMRRETELFFEEVLRHDLSLLEFVDSDWTFLNERLAKHYGIPGVEGSVLFKAKLPAGSHRGGVMTHASVLKVTADGARTSPILRGKWVCDRMLGVVPPPPPADVPKIEPDIRGAVTIREQLAKHRSSAACATCHRQIDPPGFALETFDVIGGWRDFYRVSRGKPVELTNYPGVRVNRGPDVEQGDVTATGQPFKDIDEYKQLLLADKELLARNLIRKLLIYATGADIEFADRAVVEQILQRLAKKNFGLRSLVHEVVQSQIFLSK